MLNLAQAENDTQKISLIRSFPIPNTKEDVFEFLIMAKTNFSADQSLSDNGIRTVANIALRTIGLWGGLMIFIIALILDIISHANTSVFHLGGGAVMIIGALMIRRKSEELLDVGVGVVCGILALLLGTLLQEVFRGNGSAMVLTGGTTLIIVVVRLVKSSIKK